jgi:hypothetical protein
MSTKLCRYCRTWLPNAKDNVGRPTDYCGSGCKSAARAERQRIDRHLAQREAELLDLRRAVQRGDALPVVTSAAIVRPEVRLADLEADVAALSSRLRDLFAADD